VLDVSSPPVTQPAEQRFGRLAAELVLAAAPAVVSLLVMYHWLGHTPRAYLPIVTDEVSYWHQIATFSKVGFGNGYYTYQEYTAPALSAYGAWGPGFPLLFGSLLAVVGVSYTTIVWLNLATFTALAFGALRVAGAGRWWIGGLLVTYTPLLLYLPTGMQEPLHLGLAVLLAVLFHRLLVAEPGSRRQPAIAVVTLIVLASLLRSTWALLLVPAALLAGRGFKPVLGALVAAVGFIALFPLWAAPFPYGNTFKIQHAATLGDKVHLLAANVGRNVALLLQVRGSYYQVPIAQHYQLIVAVVAALAVAVTVRRVRAASVTVCLALIPAVLFVVVFYDVGPGVRVLAAHVLFAGVFAALLRPRWTRALPALLVVTNLLTLSWFKHDFVLFAGMDVRGNRSAIAAERAALGRYLHYDPSADRWCNTILLADGRGFTQTLAVPPGFGVGVDLNHRFPGPLRSAYVIATDVTLPMLPSAGSHLVLVAPTPQGGLYRNLDSPCFAT